MYTVRCGNEPGFDWAEIAQTIAGWIEESVADGDALIPKTVDKIELQLSRGWCSVAFVGDDVVGYLTTYSIGTDQLGQNWWEVGTGIVPKQMRGNGIGNRMYMSIVDLHPRGVLACTTKMPAALILSIKAGFVIQPFRIVPENIRKELCYTASCYLPTYNGDCQSECSHSRPCVLRIRWPLE